MKEDEKELHLSSSPRNNNDRITELQCDSCIAAAKLGHELSRNIILDALSRVVHLEAKGGGGGDNNHREKQQTTNNDNDNNTPTKMEMKNRTKTELELQLDSFIVDLDGLESLDLDLTRNKVELTRHKVDNNETTKTCAKDMRIGAESTSLLSAKLPQLNDNKGHPEQNANTLNNNKNGLSSSGTKFQIEIDSKERETDPPLLTLRANRDKNTIELILESPAKTKMVRPSTNNDNENGNGNEILGVNNKDTNNNTNSKETTTDSSNNNNVSDPPLPGESVTHEVVDRGVGAQKPISSIHQNQELISTIHNINTRVSYPLLTIKFDDSEPTTEVFERPQARSNESMTRNEEARQRNIDEMPKQETVRAITTNKVVVNDIDNDTNSITRMQLNNELQCYEKFLQELRCERMKIEKLLEKTRAIVMRTTNANTASTPPTTTTPTNSLDLQEQEQEQDNSAVVSSACPIGDHWQQNQHPSMALNRLLNVASRPLSSSIQRMKRMDTLKRRRNASKENSNKNSTSTTRTSPISDPNSTPPATCSSSCSTPAQFNPLNLNPLKEANRNRNINPIHGKPPSATDEKTENFEEERDDYDEAYNSGSAATRTSHQLVSLQTKGNHQGPTTTTRSCLMQANPTHTSPASTSFDNSSASCLNFNNETDESVAGIEKTLPVLAGAVIEEGPEEVAESGSSGAGQERLKGLLSGRLHPASVQSYAVSCGDGTNANANHSSSTKTNTPILKASDSLVGFANDSVIPSPSMAAASEYSLDGKGVASQTSKAVIIDRSIHSAERPLTEVVDPRGGASSLLDSGRILTDCSSDTATKSYHEQSTPPVVPAEQQRAPTFNYQPSALTSAHKRHQTLRSSLAALLGRSPPELIGQAPSKTVHPQASCSSKSPLSPPLPPPPSSASLSKKLTWRKRLGYVSNICSPFTSPTHGMKNK